MMIELYHGSNVRVEKPDLHKSKPYKDFGQGFYLSDDKQQAWQYYFGTENALNKLCYDTTE